MTPETEGERKLVSMCRYERMAETVLPFVLGFSSGIVVAYVIVRYCIWVG